MVDCYYHCRAFVVLTIINLYVACVSHATVTGNLVSEEIVAASIDFSGVVVDALENDLLQTSLLDFSQSSDLPNGGPNHNAESTFDGLITTGQSSQDAAETKQAGYWKTNGHIQFNLDTSSATAGFDISSISIIQKGGIHRPGMNLTVKLSQVGSDEFHQYYTTGGTIGIAHHVNKLTLTDDTDVLISSNVDGVRFEFHGSGIHEWTWYREFDVVGAASVPEASNLSLIFALLMLTHSTFRRRYLK